MPKINIVISTYNQREFIERTINSIINQTYKNWDLLIIGDGCTDGTNEYLEEIDHPKIYTRVYEENAGGSFRLNEGFRGADGDYHTWIASDNVYYPTALEEMVKGLNNGVDGVYADSHYIDKDDRILFKTRRPDYNYQSLLIPMYYFVGVIFMYKAECFDKLGGYSERYPHSNDLDWWLKMGEHYKIKLIPKLLGAYRDHAHDKRFNGNWFDSPENMIAETSLVIDDAKKRSGKKPLEGEHKIICDDATKLIYWT